MTRRRAALALLLLALAIPARAEQAEPARTPGAPASEARARWESLTPEQKQELRERYRAFRELPRPVVGRVADETLLLDLRCLE